MAEYFPTQDVAAVREPVTAVSGTTPSLDTSTSNNFSITTSGNTTFTFSNPPASGILSTILLYVDQGGTYTLTWPGSVVWPLGAAPDAPSSGEEDVYGFTTIDGGTTWYGMLLGDAMA